MHHALSASCVRFSLLLTVVVAVSTHSTPLTVAPRWHLAPFQTRADTWGLSMRLRGGQQPDNVAEGVTPEDKIGREPKSFARRDLLLDIQEAAQQRWADEKIFEADSPAPETCDASLPGNQSKYFATFPYPYMNGLLHLGHAFSLTKAEFAVGYQRMLGKRCLWPFAFHCTGMPIQAAADTLERELLHADVSGALEPAQDGEGNRADLLISADAVEEKQEGSAGKAGERFQSGKSKVAAKRGNAKTQTEVLLSMGVPEDEIPLFANAEKWLAYFPALARDDLKAMGLKIDWRRTFITTEASPWYDAFVRWQFRKLKELQKVKLGKRLSIFSPRDGQICADHDRAVGEGVCPQEYTLVKMQVLSQIPALEGVEALASSQGRIYLLAATLRPETMYGQTNCWVLPHDRDGNNVYYGCYRTHVAGEFVIVSEHAAHNMAFQMLSPEFGKAEQVCRVAGADLLGLLVAAPLSQLKQVRTLPLLTISMGKGTGIVTSVPSDAPDDWAALVDLQHKKAMRDKYKIEDAWVCDLAPIAVIESVYRRDDGTGEIVTRCVAEEACKEFKVASQNDRPQLALAKRRRTSSASTRASWWLGTSRAPKWSRQRRSFVTSWLRREGHTCTRSPSVKWCRGRAASV